MNDIVRDWKELSIDKNSNQELKVNELQETIRKRLRIVTEWKSALSEHWTWFWKREIIIKAEEIIDKYWFEALWEQKDFEYLSSVISIEEFSNNPDKYFDRLAKWFWSFPLDFDIEKLFIEQFWKHWEVFFRWWKIHIHHIQLFENETLSYSLSKWLVNEWIAELWIENLISIDILSFLKNYNSFIELTRNENIDEEKRESIISTFDAIRLISIWVLNTIINTKILETKKFFDTTFISSEESKEIQRFWDKSIDEYNPFRPKNEQEQEIFLDIEDMLLNTTKWISNIDVNQMLKIQNKRQFRKLIWHLIENIKSDKTLKSSWINKIDKDISEFNLQEMIMLAVYIARYIIEDYEKQDQWVDRILLWFNRETIGWKCTDYTWMSLHIINNYLKELYPEKFQNVFIWYDTQHIWDWYKHAYIKIYWYNEKWQIVSTFIDPTKLSNYDISSLKFTNDMFEKISWSNLPIEVVRNAEDLVMSKIIRNLKNSSNLLEERWKSMKNIGAKNENNLLTWENSELNWNVFNRMIWNIVKLFR